MCFAPQLRALFRHVNSQKCSENGVLSTFWLGNVLRAITACNRTHRFSEPTFRPSGATNHWKNTVFRDYPTFFRTWIFFLLLFPSLLFSSLTVPTSAFPSLHVVGSLTSKLPSAMDLYGNIVRWTAIKYTINHICTLAHTFLFPIVKHHLYHISINISISINIISYTIVVSYYSHYGTITIVYVVHYHWFHVPFAEGAQARKARKRKRRNQRWKR